MTKNAKPGPSAPLPEIDWVSYGRCPNLPLSSLTALGRQLLTAVPARMTAALTGSREQLQFELARAEAGYTEHLLVPDPQSKRPIDMAADISWGALHGRMESLAMLPHDRYPSAARAATLRDLLFPQGLSFLTLEYGAQWAEAERRLKVIEQQRLKSEIDALCGSEVLVEVRRCHAEYAEMIGVTTPTGPMTAGAGVSARAEAMAMPALKVDGNDAQAVDAAAARLIGEIRAGQGPRLLHAVTYRFKGHVSVDPGTYRDAAEVQAAKLNDPLLITRRQLLEQGATATDIDAIDRAAQAEIEHALQVAEAAPWPKAAAAYEDIMNSGAGVWK